jgi:putative spermidine/putrescine transport system permease protein
MQVRLLVTLPLLRRPLLEAWLLGFLVSWAQLPLTLVVGGGLISTLPLEVFAYMQAGQDRYAATGALLLLIPPLIALAATRAAAGRTEAVVM